MSGLLDVPTLSERAAPSGGLAYRSTALGRGPHAAPMVPGRRQQGPTTRESENSRRIFQPGCASTRRSASSRIQQPSTPCTVRDSRTAGQAGQRISRRCPNWRWPRCSCNGSCQSPRPSHGPAEALTPDRARRSARRAVPHPRKSGGLPPRRAPQVRRVRAGAGPSADHQAAPKCPAPSGATSSTGPGWRSPTARPAIRATRWVMRSPGLPTYCRRRRGGRAGGYRLFRLDGPDQMA